MLAAIVSGLFSGVASYTALAEWVQDLPIDFCHRLGFTRRPPKLDCFRDLLLALDTEALNAVLRQWVRDSFPHAEKELSAVLSLDGKTLRGSARAKCKGVHLLTLVLHGSGAVPAQGRVDEKTNEHKAALPLLEQVLLKEVVIVADAAFCQKDVCRKIVRAEGDYVLAVKDNQPGLLRDISHEFAAADAAFSPRDAA